MVMIKTSLLLASVVAPVLSETVHGVTVFSRHGDRTSKHYRGYQLTNLGFQQNFRVGSDYRNTYVANGSPKQILNISADRYAYSQLWASAPDQQVLLNTATAFLQGLYPPIDGLNQQIAQQSLNNGTRLDAPLNGYQYVVLHGEDENSPDTIWIKGDDGCPAATAAGNAYMQSTEYQSTLSRTSDFYDRFWPMLTSVYDYREANVSYRSAYDVFDLLNVARIHNASSAAANISDEDMFQLRTLADSSEFAYNFNASDQARAIGGRTLAAGILRQLNQTIATRGALKFNLMAGSYDTFLSFFGLTDLTAASSDFFGLPDYASTMAFELFTQQNMTTFPSNPTNDMRVRFLFRNGSTTELTPFSLFGTSQMDMSWPDFRDRMMTISLPSVESWCSACRSTEDFCSAPESSADSAAQAQSSGGGLSNAVAGVIGAMVTLGVILLAALAFFLARRLGKGKKTKGAAARERAAMSGAGASKERGSATDSSSDV